MSVLKDLAREWLPPVLVRWFRQIRGGGLRFEGAFATWKEASVYCTGYDAEEILAKVLTATLKVKHGEAAFERDSVLFDQIEYAWPVLAGLMCTAARSGGRLNVLDFGGALGSSYFQNRKFLQSLPDVRWNVVEQFHYVAAGQRHIQDEQLRFYESVEECLMENQPNVILLSSVLQYLPDPFAMLNRLGAIKADMLLFDRTSFSSSGHNDRIKLQYVPEHIYKATYPCRVFNEENLCQFISGLGYQLLEAFAALDNFDPDTYWRGHVFLRHVDG
jgi:putative methyltransferase (TIGR04325 family)